MKFNNETIREAVKEWLDDDKLAELKYGHISNWDTSDITDMRKMFFEAESFNQSLGNWDVSNVTNMEGMFRKASSFNQPIGEWDVSNVTNMDQMFYQAYSFNRPIGEWDVSNVTNTANMFYSASSFNQPIGEWDVSNVTYMRSMFFFAESFNQPIGEWDVSNVINMANMFNSASSFNQPIGEWDVSNVTKMEGMFCDASSFNQPIGEWDVSNLTNMVKMFFKASSFNQPIGEWVVSNATNMTYMFCRAYSFNQPIGDWDVSNVTNMELMFFFAKSFNQSLEKWDISNVTNMDSIFEGVTSFDQPSSLNFFNLISHSKDENSIPIDGLYKKFCEKINNLENGYELKETSTLDIDFTDRLGSILSYSDINKETLSKLKNDQKLRICCLTQCDVLAYTIGNQEDNNLLTFNDIRNYIKSEVGELNGIECWNGPNHDYIAFGRKIEIEDVKNLRLETVNIKLYQEVTELFIKITSSFLKKENEELYKELLDEGDEKCVNGLKEKYFCNVNELIEIYDRGYSIDYGGFDGEEIIGHIINASTSDENSSIEVAITSGELMNDDDWFHGNYFQFYRLP